MGGLDVCVPAGSFKQGCATKRQTQANKSKIEHANETSRQKTPCHWMISVPLILFGHGVHCTIKWEIAAKGMQCCSDFYPAPGGPANRWRVISVALVHTEYRYTDRYLCILELAKFRIVGKQ